MVITIIAILASLLLPALSQAKSAATLLACKNNLRHISLAIRMYIDDNQGYYPVIRHRTGGWWHQEGIVHAYLTESNDIFTCPDDPDGSTLSYNFVWFGGGAFWHTTTNPYYEGYQMKISHDETRVYQVDVTDPQGGLLDVGLFGGAETLARDENNYMFEGGGNGWGAGYGSMQLWHEPYTNTLAVDLSVRTTNVIDANYLYHMNADPAQYWYRTAGNMQDWPYQLSRVFSTGLWD